MDALRKEEESRNLTERFVKENFEINTPPPNPAVIPESETFAVNEVTHRVSVLDPPRSSLNPAAVSFVPPNNRDNDALELTKAVVKDVRSCVLRTFLDRSSISQILHHTSFLLVNLGFTMPIELY